MDPTETKADRMVNNKYHKIKHECKDEDCHKNCQRLELFEAQCEKIRCDLGNWMEKYDSEKRRRIYLQDELLKTQSNEDALKLEIKELKRKITLLKYQNHAPSSNPHPHSRAPSKHHDHDQDQSNRNINYNYNSNVNRNRNCNINPSKASRPNTNSSRSNTKPSRSNKKARKNKKRNEIKKRKLKELELESSDSDSSGSQSFEFGPRTRSSKRQKIIHETGKKCKCEIGLLIQKAMSKIRT